MTNAPHLSPLFNAFLEKFAHILNTPDGFRPCIVFARTCGPRQTSPCIDSPETRITISVGVDKWPKDPNNWPKQFLLQQKLDNAQERFGCAPRSATELVVNCAELAFKHVDHWTEWNNLDTLEPRITLTDLINRLELQVEDVSPDSIISVLFLLARLQGVPQDELPEPWIKAVTEWETRSAATNPEANWCNLASSLSSQLDLRDPQQIREAWRRALEYAVAAMLADEDPANLNSQFRRDPSRPADAGQNAEKVAYELMLKSATRFQLYLPVAGTLDRKRQLVDGLVMYQLEPIGGSKTLARLDRQNSPLGQGFTFLAYLNPDEGYAGSGDEIVLSVTDDSHLDLTAIWKKLDDAETQAWQKENLVRPCDDPRTNIRQLPPGIDKINWNEPWFPLVAGGSNTPRTTLIGAPHCIKFHKSDGSESWSPTRLSFSAVMDIVWREARPSAFAFVEPISGSDTPLPILELPEDSAWSPTGEHHPIVKRLYLARYSKQATNGSLAKPRQPPGNISSLINSKTLKAELVARLAKPKGEIRLTDITVPTSHDEIHMVGCIAFVSEHGAWVFDDWTDHATPIEGIRQTFANAYSVYTRLGIIDGKLSGLADKLGKYLSSSKSDLTALLAETASIRADLGNKLPQFESIPLTHDLRTFRDALDRHWGISQSKQSVTERLLTIESGIQSIETETSRSSIQLITNLGLPLALGGVLTDVTLRMADRSEQILEAKAILKNCEAIAAVTVTNNSKQLAPQKKLPEMCKGLQLEKTQLAASKNTSSYGDLVNSAIPEEWLAFGVALPAFTISMLIVYLLTWYLKKRKAKSILRK